MQQRALFFLFYFNLLKKIRLDVSCESSAWQRIHLKYQSYFLRRTMKKYSRLSSEAVLIGTLRVSFNKKQLTKNSNVKKKCQKKNSKK